MDEQINKVKSSMIESLDARLNKDSANEELWIVKNFLEIHNVPFEESEVRKEIQDSKTDIVFKDMRFQVKKILYPNTFKPKSEDKELKERIIQASTIEEYIDATVGELIEHEGWHPPEVLRELIIDKSFFWTEKTNKQGKLKYPAEIREGLDLLFYIQIDDTKKRLTGFPLSEEISNRLEPSGWRSISYLFGSQSLVMYVADIAPELLKRIFDEIS